MINVANLKAAPPELDSELYRVGPGTAMAQLAQAPWAGFGSPPLSRKLG
jgi:hypothetical protein